MNPNVDQNIEEQLALFNGEVLTANLTKAALYVLAYELLKNTLMDRPKGFFSLGDENAYKTQVLSLHPSPLVASCRWLEGCGAMTPEDTQGVLLLRDHRNEIVHELPNVLLTPRKQVDEQKLSRALELLCKVDRWWIDEVEIPTREDFDGAGDEAVGQSFSGNAAFLAHLIQQVYSPLVEAKPAT